MGVTPFIFNSLIIHGGSVNDDAMVIYGAGGIYHGLHDGLWFSVMVRIVFVVYMIGSPSCRVDLIVGEKGLLSRCDPCPCCGKLGFLFVVSFVGLVLSGFSFTVASTIA